jgi:hypothetical protein
MWVGTRGKTKTAFGREFGTGSAKPDHKDTSVGAPSAIAKAGAVVAYGDRAGLEK